MPDDLEIGLNSKTDILFAHTGSQKGYIEMHAYISKSKMDHYR